MQVSAIVLAAGEGLRFKSKPPSPKGFGGLSAVALAKADKPLVKINSQPVIIYCLKTLSQHPQIDEIIVVANAKNSKDILSQINRYRIKKIKAVVLGGRIRQDSVKNGLKAIDGRADLVLIHDGVRPFIDKVMVSSLIREAKKTGAAILGVPVKDTIKKVTKSPSHKVTSNYIVEKTIDRNNLWEIQTPQVFKKEVILKAYEKFGKEEVTDDAMLTEKLGVKVSVVPGEYNNIKITTPEDLILAEAMARKWNTA